MGYSARGDGFVTLKPDIDRDKLRQRLTDVVNSVCSEMSFDLSNDPNVAEMYFYETDGHWDSEGTLSFLNAMNTYIIEGLAEYTGEERESWRYKFNPEKIEWDEQSSIKVYIYYNSITNKKEADLTESSGLVEMIPDDFLIGELKKRGYNVGSQKREQL